MSGASPGIELSELPTPLLGTVLAVQANFYQVQLDFELPILDFGLGHSNNDSEIVEAAERLLSPKSKIQTYYALAGRG